HILRNGFILKNKIRNFYRFPVKAIKKYLLQLIEKNDKNILSRTLSERILLSIEQYKSHANKIEAIINILRPSILLFSEDIVERDSNLWIKIAHTKNILSMVISYGTPSKTEAAETYCNDPNYQFPTHLPPHIKFLLKFVLNKWCFLHQKRKLIRLPLKQLVAMDLLDYSPKLPWVTNSGEADIVMVESNFAKDLFKKEGLKNKRIKVLGNLKFDAMNTILNDLKSYKAYIYEKYNLCRDRNLILCAFPSYLPERKLLDFNSYEDLIYKYVLGLQASNHHVLYSIHPSGIPWVGDKLRHLGQLVAEEKIFNLIPICDIFLATVSSTIKWARACGKLVLNYDCFGFNYDVYKKDSAVIHINSFDELLVWVDKLNNQQVSDILMELSPFIPSNYWGKIDGQSFHKIRYYIDALAK
ncbi:TPA: hypothetical protein JD758_003073, partial [Legionella pneumophila]|nr:hypothetical protein [Legionella pneumophila]HAU0508986.1 hypothetical protein [Legionella pneumophila]HCC3170929.1 hypothetical protein [Legionella pneumophila]HEK3898886.1 hypothetical protein [Legionella pneumophila]